MLVHCVNSERSDEPVRQRSLVRAFARIHDTVFVLKQLKEDAFNHSCLLNSRCRWIMHLFCCFTSQSTAMVMEVGGGRSVHLTTFFLGKLEQAVNFTVQI